jgi:hypothetical protein
MVINGIDNAIFIVFALMKDQFLKQFIQRSIHYNTKACAITK